MDDSLARKDSPFSRFAKWVSRRAGHAVAFLLALGLIVVWAVSGPLFGFSDTWQLAINTTTTIVTFLMVFLIQNSQTRDAEAIHIKLDELIESTKGARRELLDLEEMPEEELHRLQQGYEAMAAEARRRHHRGRRSGRPTPFEQDQNERGSRRSAATRSAGTPGKPRPKSRSHARSSQPRK
jgi:low affinity Fe/Cu permease